MHLGMTVQQGGLKPGESYGLSIQAKGPEGHGANIGLGDQVASDEGRVVFDVELPLLQAATRAGHPCSINLWVRPGGTPFSTPAVKPGALITVAVP